MSIAGNVLGTHLNIPYLISSYYLSDAYITENPKFLFYADVFPRLRIISGYEISTDTYPNNDALAKHLWVDALKAHNPDVYILYGCTNNASGNNKFRPRYYEATKAYTLAEAQWANEHSVDCFCVSNEHLISTMHGTNHGMPVSTLSRSSNVATATFAFDHGLTTGDYIFVYGANESSFNVTDSESVETVQCTVINSTTVTYPSAGTDGDATGTIYIDWSALEAVRKTVALAEYIRAQIPDLNMLLEYSESQGHVDAWTVGLGDITPGVDFDLFGVNAYGAGDNDAAYNAWKSEIDAAFATFGTKLIITEHNIVQEAPDTRKVGGLTYTDKGFDKTANAEIIRRFNYAKGLGITQIYLFGPWGNGVNWWIAYNTFCNTSPYGWNDSTKRHIEGRLMPLIDDMIGNRPTSIFFGNCGNT